MRKKSAIQNKLYTNVDKRKKSIYNINGKMFFLLPCAALVIGIMIGALHLLPFAALDGEENSAFSVEAEQNAQGRIIVAVSLNEGFAVCGFSAELHYRSDELTFVGAKTPAALEENGFCLTVKESDGSLSVIFDGFENLSLGNLVRFEFEPTKTSDLGETQLDLRVNEAYFWKNGRLSALPTFSSSLSIIPADEKRENELPTLDSVSVFDRGGDLQLDISGVFPQNCLAAGFDVLWVDLSNLEMQKLSLSRVISPSTDEKKGSFLIDIPDKGKICLIITPISYVARGTASGRESVKLIEGGTIKD